MQLWFIYNRGLLYVPLLRLLWKLNVHKSSFVPELHAPESCRSWQSLSSLTTSGRLWNLNVNYRVHNSLAHVSVLCKPHGQESLRSWLSQLVNQFLALYGTRMFMAVFTRALVLARWIQATHSHAALLLSQLLPDHLRGLIFGGGTHFCAVLYDTCPSRLTLLYLVILVVSGEEFSLLSHSTWQFCPSSFWLGTGGCNVLGFQVLLCNTRWESSERSYFCYKL